MNPFRKRFVRVLEADLAGPAPALGNAPAPAAPVTPQVDVASNPGLTNNPDLQASLQSTADAGAAVVGNNPIQKIPEYQTQIKDISQKVKGMLEQIKDTAGQPGTADIWKDLSSNLSKMLAIAGTIDGSLNSLPTRVAVKTQSVNKQK